MTYPNPWPHPINPTQVRQADDGRIAFCVTVCGRDWTPESRWIMFDAPNGQLQLTPLTDEDVADWRPLGCAP